MHLVKQTAQIPTDTDTTTPTPLVSVTAAAAATGLDVIAVLQLVEDGVIASEVRRVVDLDGLRRHLASQEPV
jgi:hypothetical protein